MHFMWCKEWRVFIHKVICMFPHCQQAFSFALFEHFCHYHRWTCFCWLCVLHWCVLNACSTCSEFNVRASSNNAFFVHVHSMGFQVLDAGLPVIKKDDIRWLLSLGIVNVIDDKDHFMKIKFELHCQWGAPKHWFQFWWSELSTEQKIFLTCMWHVWFDVYDLTCLFYLRLADVAPVWQSHIALLSRKMSDNPLRVNQDWSRLYTYLHDGRRYFDVREPGLIRESALQPVPPFPWQTEVLATLDQEYFNEWLESSNGKHHRGAIKCPVCDQWLNGTTQWWNHCSGNKHKRNMQNHVAKRCMSRTRRAHKHCLGLWFHWWRKSTVLFGEPSVAQRRRGRHAMQWETDRSTFHIEVFNDWLLPCSNGLCALGWLAQWCEWQGLTVARTMEKWLGWLAWWCQEWQWSAVAKTVAKQRKWRTLWKTRPTASAVLTLRICRICGSESLWLTMWEPLIHFLFSVWQCLQDVWLWAPLMHFFWSVSAAGRISMTPVGIEHLFRSQ